MASLGQLYATRVNGLFVSKRWNPPKQNKKEQIIRQGGLGRLTCLICVLVGYFVSLSDVFLSFGVLAFFIWLLPLSILLGLIGLVWFASWFACSGLVWFASGSGLLPVYLSFGPSLGVILSVSVIFCSLRGMDLEAGGVRGLVRQRRHLQGRRCLDGTCTQNHPET